MYQKLSIKFPFARPVPQSFLQSQIISKTSIQRRAENQLRGKQHCHGRAVNGFLVRFLGCKGIYKPFYKVVSHYIRILDQLKSFQH